MSYLDNAFGLFTENKKYSDNKRKNHLNEWSGGRDYSNKIQTSCELPKGKMADDFKRYLKTNNILYEPSEAWNNIHFSVFFDTQEDIDKANAFIDTLDESCGGKDKKVDKKKIKVKEDIDSADTIKVLIVEPGKAPRVENISQSLESLQRIVDGYIEVIYPFDDNVCFICNEEGKIEGLPYNRPLYGDDGQLYDVIAGTFIVAGLGAEDFASLSDNLIKKYSDIFREPLREFGRVESVKGKEREVKTESKKRKTVKEYQIIDAPDHYYNYHEGDEEDERMYDRVYRRLLPLVDDFDIDYDFLLTDEVDEIIKKLIRLIKLQHPTSLFAEDDGSYIDMYEGESVKGKTEAKKPVEEEKKPLKEKIDTEFLKELKALRDERLANVKSLANMTKEELWQLRNEIKLGSLFTRDYENEFGIDPSYVQSTFDGFLEYVEDEMRNDIPDYDDNDFWELLDNYDTPEYLDEYCNYMLEWSDEDIRNMTKEARQEIEDWYQDELYYADVSDVKDEFGADTL